MQSLQGVAGKEAEVVRAQASQLLHLHETSKQLAERKDFAGAAKMIEEMLGAGGSASSKGCFCVFLLILTPRQS